MKLLDIIEVNKKFNDTQACSNVNISINEGEFFTLLGPSGCGKTTLLRIIAGFETLDSGEITINDKSIVNTPIEKRNIGMVFQNYALFPHMNVFDNIAYGLKIKGEKKHIIKEKVSQYLNIVNLYGYERREIAQLSGGEQQRVALARALIIEPQILLLDEPLSNLDAKLRDQMRIELKLIQKKLGITTIFVTHDQNEALIISDRIAVFNKGKCLQVGIPSEIYETPTERFVATFVGESNIFYKDQFPIKKNYYKKYIIIRPQNISLNKEQGHMSGIIEFITITGVLIEYNIRVDKKLIKVVMLNNKQESNNYKVNDQVFLIIDENKINTFDD